MPNWKGFPNIEQPKEPKSQKNIECRKPIPTRSVPECDHLSYDFINDNPLSIMSPQMFNA